MANNLLSELKGAADDGIERRASLAEQVFVAVAVISLFVLPPLFLECFPLSTCSMFAQPYHKLRHYVLCDADEQRLDNDLFGLRANVNWYLEHTYAVKFPPNHVAPPDREVDVVQLAPALQRTAIQENVKFPLRLRIDCFGDVDGRTVGLNSQQKWRIDRDGLPIRLN